MKIGDFFLTRGGKIRVEKGSVKGGGAAGR